MRSVLSRLDKCSAYAPTSARFFLFSMIVYEILLQVLLLPFGISYFGDFSISFLAFLLVFFLLKEPFLLIRERTILRVYGGLIVR